MLLSVKTLLAAFVRWGFPAPDCRGKTINTGYHYKFPISGTAEIRNYQKLEERTAIYISAYSVFKRNP